MHSQSPPSQDIFEASRFPESMATSYHAIYAHGMHFRVRDAEDDKVTCDSGVASSVWHQERESGATTATTLTGASYVDWVEEILELNYKSHCVVVLVYSWISGDLERPNPKVVKDKYGFTLGNFQRTIPLGKDSFAFPTQCRQVYYSKDEAWNNKRGGDWRVIIGTEVRGRRIAVEDRRPDIPLLNPGRDEDYKGLRGISDYDSSSLEEELDPQSDEEEDECG
jgi:hypothetical protein